MLTYLFLFICLSDVLSIRLEVEFIEDSKISQDHLDMAVQFGINLDNSTTTNKAQKYVVAFFRNLLMQREKINEGLLTDYLKLEISEAWQEVLSSLEDRDRKLVDVQSGSLIFVLFCPNNSSLQQLKNEGWMNNLASNMKLLLKVIGIMTVQ